MTLNLPPSVNAAVRSAVGGEVRGASRLSGGDISAVYRVDLGHSQVVVKVRQEKSDYPRLFFAEAQGLHLLRQAGALCVPEVLGYGVAGGGWAYLILSYLEGAPETPQGHEALGRGLAALHRVSAAQFGGTPENFMGFLPQVNPAMSSAAEFFWSARLEPQLKLAHKHLNADDMRGFDRLWERLPVLIPAEPPALVHGDLWHGNVLFTGNGPAVIDPAATYCHREVDLGLLRLFGGVDERVFEAYHEAFPLEPGWQERTHLWNLYPLLAHVNMFGGSYLGRLRESLARLI